jgi:hypothetical protein
LSVDFETEALCQRALNIGKLVEKPTADNPDPPPISFGVGLLALFQGDDAYVGAEKPDQESWMQQQQAKLESGRLQKQSLLAAAHYGVENREGKSGNDQATKTATAAIGDVVPGVDEVRARLAALRAPGRALVVHVALDRGGDDRNPRARGGRRAALVRGRGRRAPVGGRGRRQARGRARKAVKAAQQAVDAATAAASAAEAAVVETQAAMPVSELRGWALHVMPHLLHPRVAV